LKGRKSERGIFAHQTPPSCKIPVIVPGEKMKTEFNLSRQNIFVIAFFGLLAVLLSMLLSLLEPFIGSFMWATILVMVFYPLYSRFLKWTGNHPSLAAFFTTTLVLAFLALPGFFIIMNLARELPNAYDFISNSQWDQKSLWVMDKLKSLNIGAWLQNWGIDSTQTNSVMQKEITANLQRFADLLLQKVAEIFNNLPLFCIQVVFVTVAVFFFFRDGSRLAIRAIEFLPLEKDYQKKVSHTFSVTVTAVVRAVFLCAMIQGGMTGIGLYVAGVPLPILLGLVAFVNSFIPFLGAASVWIPACIWLLYQNQTMAALGLGLWGIIITAVDQILRPWLIGNEAKLPVFWLFFTTIGGLKVYGFIGIFLGPIILSMGMAFLAIYREIYLNTSKTTKSRD
jgi:predicted PurR-regulated permease PerM